LLDEKNTAIKKAEGPTTLFTGHKDREERRTGEGKVEEGVGIALLSCLECSTVPEGREKGVLATVANIVLGVWENILFPL